MTICPCHAAEVRKRRLNALWEGSKMPEPLRGKTFDTFRFAQAKAHDQHEDCFRWARDFKLKDPAKPNTGTWKGLLLYSAAKGTGKTHLMSAIANHLIEREIPILFIAAPDLFGRLREDSFALYEPTLQACCEATVLFIDDVGQERPSDWTREAYFRVINHRETHAKPTCVTSNTKALAEVVGEAAASRLIGMTRRINFDGIKDYRLRDGVT